MPVGPGHVKLLGQVLFRIDFFSTQGDRALAEIPAVGARPLTFEPAGEQAGDPSCWAALICPTVEQLEETWPISQGAGQTQAPDISGGQRCAHPGG